MAFEKREKKYFGTNGVRGVTGVDMTPVFALGIAQAFGTMLGEGKTVGLGRDTRTSGPALGAAVRAGLMACGCDVIDFGVVPTPCLQYLVLDHKLDGGVMITASHNPPEYNGIKIIEADGTEMGDERTLELEDILIQKRSVVSAWDKVGNCTEEPQARKLYIDSIVVQFPKDCGKGITVAVDPGNGPAAATTAEILRRLGCNVHTINAEFNGLFPGRLPEPSPEGLANLSALVQATGAAFGVAHDGDADRAIFVDENGAFMDGNITFALLASYFCEKNPGSVIVTPVSTSGIVAEVGKKYNCTTTYTVVGSIYVARTMRELIANKENIVIGGEGNGGIIYPKHQFCRDGGMSAATMLGFVAAKSEPLSKLIEELPKFTMYQEKRKTTRAKEVVAHMKKYFANCPIDDRDGVRITRGGAWALIRPSGTEPLVRFFAESQDPAEAKILIDEIFTEIKPYLE